MLHYGSFRPELCRGVGMSTRQRSLVDNVSLLIPGSGGSRDLKRPSQDPGHRPTGPMGPTPWTSQVEGSSWAAGGGSAAGLWTGRVTVAVWMLKTRSQRVAEGEKENWEHRFRFQWQEEEGAYGHRGEGRPGGELPARQAPGPAPC